MLLEPFIRGCASTLQTRLRSGQQIFAESIGVSTLISAVATLPVLREPYAYFFFSLQGLSFDL